MSSCLPGTSSMMNQPSSLPSVRACHTACCAARIFTLDFTSIALTCSDVSFGSARTNSRASGKMSACACSTPRYWTAKEAGEAGGQRAAGANQRMDKGIAASEIVAHLQADFGSLELIQLQMG